MGRNSEASDALGTLATRVTIPRVKQLGTWPVIIKRLNHTAQVSNLTLRSKSLVIRSGPGEFALLLRRALPTSAAEIGEIRSQSGGAAGTLRRSCTDGDSKSLPQCSHKAGRSTFAALSSPGSHWSWGRQYSPLRAFFPALNGSLRKSVCDCHRRRARC